jgi:hypothetical protein
MGEMALPESPDEALALLRVAVAPAPESSPAPDAAQLSDVQRIGEAQGQFGATLDAQGQEIAALRTEMAGLAQALSVVIERVTQVELSPVVPAVVRSGQPTEPDAKARITELERIIRTGRNGRPLPPDAAEVQELGLLYQRQRGQA